MTSDAKIGLLLGLLFIFIIALIINGLPNSRNEENNNELTTNMVRPQNKTPGIGSMERQIIRRTNEAEKQHRNVTQGEPTDDRNIRYTKILPKNPGIVKKSDEALSVVPANPTPAVKKKDDLKVESSKPILPRTYVAAAGDNLTIIAKKFYGVEEGNGLINVAGIFQANRGLLKSPDRICEGQRIVIPPLPASYQKKKTDNVFSSRIFQSVKSIGRKHLLTDKRKVKQDGQYVVREDDSLWRIAAEQLGDGGRYTEIAKLNADILEDEDTITVGMRLKMPAR